MISSHNLDDLGRVITDLAVIDAGKLRLFEKSDVLQEAYGRLSVPHAEPLPAAVMAEVVAAPPPGSDPIWLVRNRHHPEVRAWTDAQAGVTLDPVNLTDLFHLLTCSSGPAVVAEGNAS